MELVTKIVIPLNPRTKKNSQQIRWRYRGRKKVPYIAPSEAFYEYQECCGFYLIKERNLNIDFPVNIRCHYYRDSRRRVDLTNLLSATMDILVHYGVIKDDDCKIAASHDGSRVFYDKDVPRAEIFIEKTES